MENNEIIEIVENDWCENCKDFTTKEVHKTADTGMIVSVLCLYCNHSIIYET